MTGAAWRERVRNFVPDLERLARRISDGKGRTSTVLACLINSEKPVAAGVRTDPTGVSTARHWSTDSPQSAVVLELIRENCSVCAHEDKWPESGPICAAAASNNGDAAAATTCELQEAEDENCTDD